MDNNTTSNKEQNNQTEPNREKKGHGCLATIVVTLLIFAVMVGLIIYIDYMQSDKNNPNKDTPGIFERRATLNDITVTEDKLDFAALGQTLVFNPKCDIENLELTFEFIKGNNTLKTVVKRIGNVIEGKQYSVTISITDLSWDIIFGSDVKCKYYVSGGTKTVFS